MSKILESRGYKVFMAKLYGIGASVVMVGALFKLTHWPGANIMLTVGLITEAIIFFFSAFEPPHVEPDWSLVFPEFAGLYGHEDMLSNGTSRNFANNNGGNSNSAVKELDKMFESAGIDSRVLNRLSEGLTKLSDNAAQMADLSDTVAASNNFAGVMNKAAESVNLLDTQLKNTMKVNEMNTELQRSIADYIDSVNLSVSKADALNQQMGDLSNRMTALNTIYGNMLNAMNVKA